jgi:hypothetical protein
LTLLVHALFLMGLWLGDWGGVPVPTRYAEVGLMDEPLEQVVPRSLEDELRAGMEERVANLLADASKELVNERIQSGDRTMAESVEAELRSFEAAEMERLAAEPKDFGLEGVPEVDDRSVETLSGWDARYEGNVTVEFNLPGRRAKHLDVPGYRCRGGARVVVEVEVNRAGEVRAAVVSPVLVPNLEPCFIDAALQSARKSSFYIDDQGRSVTKGTLTYTFVPQ